MLITVGFAISAHLARTEADIRRAQAEGLISFMLGDLRAKLEPVGRLDLLDAVGDEAMNYFALLDKRGTEQEVYSRAMALRQIGEVRFRQGHLASAQEAFEESRDVNEALFKSAPENSTYLFELGQAEFWVGYAALEQSNLEQTEVSFTKYMEYSSQLLSREPDNTDYQLELSYAHSNLGTVALENGDPQIALRHFQQSTSLDEKLVAADPENLYLKQQLGNGYSWVGAAQLELGHLEESESAYQAALESLSDLHDTGENRLFTEHYGQNAYHLGNVHMHQGELKEDEFHFRRAIEIFNELEAFDPDNAIWRSDRGISAYHLAELFMLTAREVAAQDQLARALADFEQIVAADPGDFRVVERLALAERLLALTMLDKSVEQALELSDRAQSRMLGILAEETVKTRTILNASIVAETHGRILWRSGNEESAVSTWEHALALLTSHDQFRLTQVAVERQIIQHLRGEETASRQTAQLADAGFKDPRFR